MQIKKRVVEVGSSLGIVIDRVVIKTLNIKKGDVVVIHIKKDNGSI